MGSSQSKHIQPPAPIPATRAEVEESPAPVSTVVTSSNNNNNGETTSSKLPLNHPKIPMGSGGGGCPMKKKGGYFGGLFGGRGSNDNGSNAKTSQNEELAAANQSACPVQNKSSKSGCPVKAGSQQEQIQYNVYSQPIDPKNNMPTDANQLPSPMQSEELSVDRVQSTIPKGGTDDGTWTYPSPQMFYNSLARKNKLGDTEESDIESVVALHNNMNEKTWAKVMEWEEVLGGQHGNESKLLKFLGRPSDLSPKARFKNMIFGHPLPFDRHDWTILRSDGTEVRYVIDYYYDESKASEKENSGMPDLHDRNAVQSILVDVRPAVDSVENVFGRTVTMPYARRVEKTTKFEPLPLFPTDDMKQQVGESEKVWENIQKSVQESKRGAATQQAKSMILSKDDIPKDQQEDEDGDDAFDIQITDQEARDIAQNFATMLDKCKHAQELVQNCKDETECSQYAAALSMCLAKVVCPVQHDAVAKALNVTYDENDETEAAAYNATFEKTLENMSVCVVGKSQVAAVARKNYPDYFSDLNK